MSSSDATTSSSTSDQKSHVLQEDAEKIVQVGGGSRDSGSEEGETTPTADKSAPPLPAENPPPLPSVSTPSQHGDDGWEPVWDPNAQAYYFFNRLTKLSQWENPRVPTSTQPPPPGVDNYDSAITSDTAPPTTKAVAGGYDPAVHGDYDPNADYAKVHEPANGQQDADLLGTDPTAAYSATGTFNRFTGKWQNADFTPERFDDENKSRRQMNAFFDVEAAANVHEGKSLKAERANKKLSKAELRAFKDKRREKKEEKRRAWLRD